MSMEFKLTINMRQNGEMTFELARWPDEKALLSLVAKIKHLLDKNHEVDDERDDDANNEVELVSDKDGLEEAVEEDLDDIPYPVDSEPIFEVESQRDKELHAMMFARERDELPAMKRKQAAEFLDYYLGPMAGYNCPKFKYQSTEMCERYYDWARANSRVVMSGRAILQHLTSVIQERGWDMFRKRPDVSTSARGGRRSKVVWPFVNMAEDEATIPPAPNSMSIRAFLTAMFEHEDHLISEANELYDRYQEWCKSEGRDDVLETKKAFWMKLGQVGRELGLTRRTLRPVRDGRVTVEIRLYKSKATNNNNEQQENEQ